MKVNLPPVLAFTQVDKFLPLHQRKKLLQEQRPPPVVFEVVPCSGTLSHGEKVNVQVKFSPAEGVRRFTDFRASTKSCSMYDRTLWHTLRLLLL